jgi:hypothetical protein
MLAKVFKKQRPIDGREGFLWDMSGMKAHKHFCNYMRRGKNAT